MENNCVEIVRKLENEIGKPNIPARLADKASLFVNAMKDEKLKIREFRRLCFHGIPDNIKGLRPTSWKILMNLHSLSPVKWPTDLENAEKNYEEYLKEFLGYSKDTKAHEKHMNNDHPLSKSENSHWKKFFADTELWEEIEKDTKRTRSDMHFFLSPTNKKEKKFFAKFANKGENETHTDVLSRILFIYAKLNPGVAYVQGMNEVLAPIYFVFCHDNVDSAECESFFCFNSLMGDLMDCFLRSLDKSKQGINARLQDFQELMHLVDNDLATFLTSEGVVPHFYALRWILLLMTQEFDILTVIRLWDSMLSTSEKSDFIQYICAAHVLEKKEDIMGKEFHVIMAALQNFEMTDIEKLISNAKELHDVISNKTIF